MSKTNPLDYIFLLRPLILIPSWNFLLIGSYLARGRGGFTWELIIGLFLYTCVMGGTYIFNQIADRDSDRINKKLFLLSEGFITVRSAYIEMIFLWSIALVGSFFLGMSIFITIIISLIMGAAYSLPPIKLKGRPILDALANGIGYGAVNLAVGWLLVRSFDGGIFIRFLPYVLSITAVFINTTIVDIAGDKKTGEMTTAVVLGACVSYIVSSVLMIAAIIGSWVMRDYVCLVASASSLPLILYVMIRYMLQQKVPRNATIASFRIPGIIFSLITCFLFPWYIIFLIVVVISMRLYYKNRFGIVYPSISGG